MTVGKLSAASLLLFACLAELASGFTLPSQTLARHLSTPCQFQHASTTSLAWRPPSFPFRRNLLKVGRKWEGNRSRSGKQVVNQSSEAEEEEPSFLEGRAANGTLAGQPPFASPLDVPNPLQRPPQEFEDDNKQNTKLIRLLRFEQALRQRGLERSEAADVTTNIKVAQGKKKAGVTVVAATLSLVKVCLGTGVLALPYGLAAASDYPSALVPASILLAVLGALSAYTFQLYGRLTHDTQATNLGEVWERTKGKETSWIISASTFSFCFGVALVYSLVIGDFLSNLAMSFGRTLPAIFARRQFWILSVTLSTLLPLCNLKSLAALAPVSILGTAGTLLTIMFMAIRCPAIFANSPYSVAASGAIGKFAAAAAPALAPQFNTYSNLISPAALIIAGMSTTAYLAHFNAPEFYHGFRNTEASSADKSTATKTTALDNSIVVEQEEADDRRAALQKFGKMTGTGFAGVTVMNIFIMAFGFLTFGGNCGGVVLNNYATADRGASFCRLLMTISVIGSYPFLFGGCKTAFMQLFNKGNKGSDLSKNDKWIVRALLAALTSLALIVNDTGLVVSLIGCLAGSAIIYVYPALMFLSHTSKQIQGAGGVVSKELRLERWASRFLVTFGVISGLIAAGVSMINSIAPHLLR